MKENHIRINWLIPVLGIALVAIGAIAAATYLELERQNYAAEMSMARMNRLRQDLELCAVLRTIHEGDVNAATRQLDLLLCNDIVAVESQLASTDAEEQAFIRNAFARFTLVRPTSAELLAEAGGELRSDQVEAERILAEAATALLPGAAAVAVLP